MPSIEFSRMDMQFVNTMGKKFKYRVRMRANSHNSGKKRTEETVAGMAGCAAMDVLEEAVEEEAVEEED